MKRLPIFLGAFILSFVATTGIAFSANQFSGIDKKQSRSSVQVIYGYNHPTMQGWKKSVYRGKYYDGSQENWRKCVQKRESHHRYGAKSKVSTASGAYQFLDSQWREPLAHMVYPELKKMYGKSTAKSIKERLFDNPISKWSRSIQDQAFFTVLNYNGKWSGKKHWSSQFGGHAC